MARLRTFVAFRSDGEARIHERTIVSVQHIFDAARSITAAQTPQPIPPQLHELLADAIDALLAAKLAPKSRGDFWNKVQTQARTSFRDPFAAYTACKEKKRARDHNSRTYGPRHESEDSQ